MQEVLPQPMRSPELTRTFCSKHVCGKHCSTRPCRVLQDLVLISVIVDRKKKKKTYKGNISVWHYTPQQLHNCIVYCPHYSYFFFPFNLSDTNIQPNFATWYQTLEASLPTTCC